MRAGVNHAQHRGGHRAHAGGSDQGRFRSFERGQHMLGLLKSGIGIARVELRMPRLAGAFGEIFGRAADKVSGLINGRNHGGG
jgi:hypothetical protein